MNAIKTIPEISHEQRKKIFALSRQAGMSSEDLHSHMEEWTGVNSLSKGFCNIQQANKIIFALQKIVNAPTQSYIPTRKRKGTLTDKQFNAIRAIKRSLGWNDARVSGFAKHTVDNSDIEDLSVKEASKLITGLKRMLPQ